MKNQVATMQLISEFKEQTNEGLLNLLSRCGRTSEIECMNLKGFSKDTEKMSVYVFVSKTEAVALLVDWNENPTITNAIDADSVLKLSIFIRQYMQALVESEVAIPKIWGVLITNSVFRDCNSMQKTWESMGITVYQGYGNMLEPEVHFSYKFHRAAMEHYIAFRLWCERQGFMKHDPYAFDGIDAEYDEMEYGLDIDDNDFDDDNEFDDDDEFKDDDELPFPKEVDKRFSDIVVNSQQSSKKCLENVLSVKIDIQRDADYYSDAPLEIVLKAKNGNNLSQKRFTCFVYTDDYYPIFEGGDYLENSNSENTELTIEVSCKQIWLPGKYFIVISDKYDYTSVVRIDFSLDKNLYVTQGERIECGIISVESTLVNCLSQADNWRCVAHTSGASLIRQRVIQATQMHLFNEFRKDSYGEIRICSNLLICMKNPSVSFLAKLQRIMAPDYDFKYVDCSKLFDVSRTNPYELLPEILDDIDIKVLCLTRINELTGSSGKVILRKIIDMIHRSDGKTILWLCGTHHEVDDLLNMFPSLKLFFQKDSWLDQQTITSFELVQSFSNILNDENIEASVLVKNRLARTLFNGCELGLFNDWYDDDIRCFIESEILPRYIKRHISPCENDNDTHLLLEEDIPFEKLNNLTSSYEQSICELNCMIGLDEVKHGISTMANQARLFIERRRIGLKTSDNQVYHSIFTGNPGTGKTTVARLLGKIYHSLGLLSKGEVIAVDRTKLVGQYIGQTEENMKAILEEAKGNVLFVDEAYTLFTGSEDSKDFGRRVLDSLLTVLTQQNPDMLIVFAGYTKEMDAMLSINPGLSSRFPYRYRFEDYSPDQLMEIAMRLFEREDYVLSDEAVNEMQKSISEAIIHKTANFGNARWIDHFVHNGIIPSMADRIFSTGCNDYQRIEACDIRKAFEKFNPVVSALKPRHRVVGFTVSGQ